MPGTPSTRSWSFAACVRRGRRTLAQLACTGLALTAIAACGGGGSGEETAADSTARFRTVAKASISSGVAVPAPQGKPVLTVKGPGVTANAPAGLSFDLATIERLGLVELNIYEPFDKKRMSFTGVELGHVAEVAGLPKTAGLHLVALDDYQVDFSPEQLRARGALLATRMDGKPIPIAKGGPIRVVFADDSKLGKDTNLWIWSVVTIEGTEG
jgi:hypothetical protein